MTRLREELAVADIKTEVDKRCRGRGSGVGGSVREEEDFSFGPLVKNLRCEKGAPKDTDLTGRE